jgi:hypothetical protein
LRYLGAYTHRVAISNHGNKKKLMTLPVNEFLRRFLLHLLPRGLVRIRHFGFLANRRRAGSRTRKVMVRAVRMAFTSTT